MTACKHAVKGGMALTAAEKEKLFEMLRGDMGFKMSARQTDCRQADEI